MFAKDLALSQRFMTYCDCNTYQRLPSSGVDCVLAVDQMGNQVWFAPYTVVIPM